MGRSGQGASAFRDTPGGVTILGSLHIEPEAVVGGRQGSLWALSPAHQCYWLCGSAERCSLASQLAPGWAGASPSPPSPSAARGQHCLISGLASAAVPVVGSPCEQPGPGERAAPHLAPSHNAQGPTPRVSGKGAGGPPGAQVVLAQGGPPSAPGFPHGSGHPLTWMAALRAWRAFSSRAFLLAASFCWCWSRRVPSPRRCRCP